MKPEPESLAALSAVVDHDLAALRKMDELLERSSQSLQSDACEYRDLAATAYLLHNIYNAVENSFQQISRTFENHVVDRAQWHRELLDKMFLAIPAVRPCVLPESLRRLLNDLRGFRHLFRHSYDFELDRQRLRQLVQDWRLGKAALFDALTAFHRHLLVQAGIGEEGSRPG